MTWKRTTYTPHLDSCDFEVLAVEPVFLRGDVNGDSAVDLSDPVALLGCKFLGDPCTTCRDAGDANDDGSMDISDAIHLLTFLYLGGYAPESPGSSVCGADPTEDGLPPCDYSGCGLSEVPSGERESSDCGE